MNLLQMVDSSTRRALLALLSPLLPGLFQPTTQLDHLQALSFELYGGASDRSCRPQHVAPSVLASTKIDKEEDRGSPSLSTQHKPAKTMMTGTQIRAANLLVLSDPDDEANAALLLPSSAGAEATLPPGCTVVGVGTTVPELVESSLSRNTGVTMEDVNAVFVSHFKAREPLAQLLREYPKIEWIHTRSAGIDFVTSSALASFGGIVTNARGKFSSTLAEYAMLAVSYFAKDLPRLLQNQKDKNWDKYDIREVRGSTLGIVGYGDIGRAAAVLAKAYGMKVQAVRRRRSADRDDDDEDSLADAVYGNTPDELRRLFSESDYVLCALPLTPETAGMIDKTCFDSAKRSGCVFINVGRGPVVDQSEMIEALRDGRLRGAALDVFDVEPLPPESPLWEMPNVLVSPHNMDKTSTFMHESTEFYVREQLPRFVRSQALLNPVDPKAGY